MKERKRLFTSIGRDVPAAESIAGNVSGAWASKDTRLPVSIVFDNDVPVR
jgi:hypothetical protein